MTGNSTSEIRSLRFGVVAPISTDMATWRDQLRFAPGDATAPILCQWHDKLVAWTGECEAVPIPPAVRLGLELAAFLLFAATVIEFFDPAAPGERIREAEKADGGAGAFRRWPWHAARSP